MEVSEYVLQMLRCQETFRRAEFADKIEQAETSTYIPSYHDEFYDEGDWVYVQEHDKKGVWSGPFKVIKQEGNEVVIDKDGEYGTTRLHPCKVARAKFEANENKEENAQNSGYKIKTEENNEIPSGVKTRSQTRAHTEQAIKNESILKQSKNGWKAGVKTRRSRVKFRINDENQEPRTAVLFHKKVKK